MRGYIYMWILSKETDATCEPQSSLLQPIFEQNTSFIISMLRINKDRKQIMLREVELKMTAIFVQKLFRIWVNEVNKNSEWERKIWKKSASTGGQLSRQKENENVADNGGHVNWPRSQKTNYQDVYKSQLRFILKEIVSEKYFFWEFRHNCFIITASFI